MPIPGPLPLGGDPRQQLGTNDRDYLKRQLGILEGYTTTLEEEVAEVEVSHAALASTLAQVRDDLDAAESEIERLNAQIGALEQRDAEREADFAGLAGRWRYQMVDRWYHRATSSAGAARRPQRRWSAPPRKHQAERIERGDSPA